MSPDSFKRFVTCFLGVDETEFGYHQTLTFNRDVPVKEAKKLLTQLFKKLIRKFPKIVLFYAMRRQRQTNRLHFHVRVHFYREDGLPFPETLMERRLRTIIFAEWNKLNSGKLNRRAHELNRHPKDLNYLMNEATVVDSKTKTARPKGNVWGCANKKVLLKHFTEPTPEAIQEEMDFYVQKPPPPPAPFSVPLQERHYSMAWLRKEKKDTEYSEEQYGGMSWETRKRIEMGRDENASDEEYLAFKNRWRPLTKAEQAIIDEAESDLPF